MILFLEILLGIFVCLAVVAALGGGIVWGFAAIIDGDDLYPFGLTRALTALASLACWVLLAALGAFIATHVDFGGNDCGPGTHQADVGGTYMSTKGGMTYIPDLKCVRD